MSTRGDRRLSWAIFAILTVTYAYFYQGGGWNENSHMDLVRAVVDERRLAIDTYQTNTGDKARVGDHYYSDKAPGLSVAAIPAYALVKAFQSKMSAHTFAVIASYVATVLTVGVATAFLGVLLYRAGRRLGASPRGSLLGALSYGVGTTAFPFATQFFSHQLAACLLFASFWLLWDCRERYSDWRSFGAGLLSAAAAISEFPSAGVALIFFVYHADAALRRRRLMTFAGGLLIVAIPLLVYLTAAFGSPFRTGYSVLADAGARGEMLGRGWFGISYPKLGVLAEISIGRYRGMLPYSPVLLLAFAGFALGFGALSSEHADAPKLRSFRRELFAAAAIVAYFFVFVSSYEWWFGGASFGARHLLPMLPFLVLPLAWVADVRPKLSAGLFAVSFAIMTIVTSVQPKPSEKYKDPFFSELAPAFFRGELAAGTVCPLVGNTNDASHRPFLEHGYRDAFNLGMFFGGRRLGSLLPFAALWLSAGAQLWLATRRLNGARPEPVPAEP